MGGGLERGSGMRVVNLLVTSVWCGVMFFVATACADGGVGGETRSPKNFDECVAEQGVILKSLPTQCVAADGTRFVKVDRPTGSGRGCKDLCGDGVCQEIVCMALGCPCPESATSCPKDCSSAGS